MNRLFESLWIWILVLGKFYKYPHRTQYFYIGHFDAKDTMGIYIDETKVFGFRVLYINPASESSHVVFERKKSGAAAAAATAAPWDVDKLARIYQEYLEENFLHDNDNCRYYIYIPYTSTYDPNLSATSVSKSWFQIPRNQFLCMISTDTTRTITPPPTTPPIAADS